ncbi:zinc finger protein [Cryptosporidium canis]|uniref:Zinc finger protein n=1 Tax=Cryptosporidium canis TaxID=195482 RepID=A0ABQ8PA05_9CRYT|nr:zinc finger protein [Cryptosporidium canis]KAJ1613220.1 zinc finger protein [Cryptosporidium canis]
MGRKKRKVAEIKPFCYYCNREFGDEKVLKQHQKVRHLKCLHCSRKLSTVSGLIVHMLQVHKETLSRIPNAIPGRDIPDLVINGMKGVPAELIEERIKEQNVEIDIQNNIKNFNPHGNKVLAMMNEIAKEFVKEHSKFRSILYYRCFVPFKLISRFRKYTCSRNVWWTRVHIWSNASLPKPNSDPRCDGPEGCG